MLVLGTSHCPSGISLNTCRAAGQAGDGPSPPLGLMLRPQCAYEASRAAGGQAMKSALADGLSKKVVSEYSPERE